MSPVNLPDKADAISIVDPDTVLPNPISFERFQPIARWNPHIAEVDRRFKLVKLAACNCLNARPTPSDASLKELLRVLVLEALDHP